MEGIFKNCNYMQSFMDSLIHPLGWHPWNDSDYALSDNRQSYMAWLPYHKLMKMLQMSLLRPILYKEMNGCLRQECLTRVVYNKLHIVIHLHVYCISLSLSHN